MASGYADLKNELVSAANGVAYAYRDTGGGGAGAAPLVLLQHFRGNLDNWDPALVDALSSTRRVVAFDPMVRPHYSYLLAGLIPHARVKIYPDAAHGFLFQHHVEFAADAGELLTAGSS